MTHVLRVWSHTCLHVREQGLLGHSLWCLIQICAACRLESVWTVPSIDSTTGQVVFPLGAYFTTLAGAQKFYNLVNLHPQTIFSESGGLSVSASF